MPTQGLEMKAAARTLAVCLIAAILFLSGCTSKPTDNVINVQGTWRAPQFSVTDCSPADVCAATGFLQGTTLSAVLVLNQVRSDLNGTYSYEGTPVSVPVGGSIGVSGFLALSGVTTLPLGSVTVNISGTISGDALPATVTHQITLPDGRVAIITGSGTFTR